MISNQCLLIAYEVVLHAYEEYEKLIKDNPIDYYKKSHTLLLVTKMELEIEIEERGLNK